jgi:superfamily II DNA or RNA helicase
MSTILTKNGYVLLKNHYEDEDIEEIKKECKVSPFVLFDSGVPPSSFRVYRNSKNQLILPRHYGMDLLGEPDIDRLKDFEPEKISVEFSGSLRKEQQDIVDIYLKHKETGGGIISIPCGGGKTVIGLGIMAQLGVKTIVIVHKEFLVNQWKDRIKQFLPTARIGHIQAGVVIVKNCDIIIAMLQSVSMKDYPPETFSDIGLAVFDECHHLGAEVFMRSFFKVSTKYMLGLSATPDRKDGLTKVFKWFIGPIIYCRKARDKDDICEVQVYKYTHEDPSYSRPCLRWDKKPDFVKMLSNIINWEDRDNIILKVLTQSISENRNILILSERIKHLERLYMKICKLEIFDGNPSIGYYIGGMKEAALKDTESRQVILGSFKMASEGMDIPHLDTVFLVSPKSDIEQSVGRILRLKAKDRINTPRIIDISDSFSTFKNQEYKRLDFYTKNRYPIQIFDKDMNFIRNHMKKQKKQKTQDIPNFCIL